MKGLLFGVFVVSLTLVACAQEPDAATPVEPGPVPTELIELPADFVAPTTIRLAIVEKKGVFEHGADGKPEGFLYDLSAEFADFIGSSIEEFPVHFNDLFALNGVVPSQLGELTDLRYTPDLSANADMVAGNITILPYREVLWDMVPFVGTRILVIGRKGGEISSIEGIRGGTVGIVPNTTYEDTAIEWGFEDRLGATIVPVEFTANSLDLLARGDFDFTLMDSQRFFLDRGDQTDTVTALFPLSPRQELGFLFPSGQEELREAFRIFIRSSKTSGRFDKVWAQSFPVSHQDYEELIGEKADE